jgi:tRNA uridine 5-carbamoylmethylation protein Kti12
MGPLVMLKDRAFSSEIVILDILNYLEAMNHTLELRGMNIRPRDGGRS